ncbi:MAG: hypothetical protein LBD18_03525 [Treponema sp.]|nr:hypothetical protein [Treponema sp.]
MRKLLLPIFIISTLVCTACNNPAGQDSGGETIIPADKPYEVDLVTNGAVLWDSGATVTPNAEDGSVVIHFPSGIAAEGAAAWGVNLYTGEEGAAGMDLSGYGSIEIVWSATYPAGTPDTDNDGNPNKQIVVNILCGGYNATDNKKLSKYPGLGEAEKTESISLSVNDTFTLEAKKNVYQIVFQAKVPNTVLTIQSITVAPLKTEGNVFTGSASWWLASGIETEILSTFQNKNDVLKIYTPGDYPWGPIRVDLSDYAEKNVTLKVSVNVWMDQASKIMWQTDAAGYPVIAGGNSSYDANTWVLFEGETTATLRNVEKDGEGNITGCPWFYLDDAGLKNGASYYFADLKLEVLE